MDRDTLHNFEARIRAANTADVAKDIDVDIYMARHDYFGRLVCEAYEIPYRNDVPFVDIILDAQPDVNPLTLDIPNITPDNYIIYHGIIFLIDYKVTLSMETVNLTLNKYTEATRGIALELGIQIEVVIIQINPKSREVYISNDLFRNLFGSPPLDADFRDFYILHDQLHMKFAEDEEFLLKTSHGDFTLTVPWITEDTPELLDHVIFQEFINSMPMEYQDLFMESVNYDAYLSERWNSLLFDIKNKTKLFYDQYVKEQAKMIFLTTGKYSKPTKNEISEGWDQMSARIRDMRDIQDSHVMQKPSIHTIWADPDPKESNNTNAKLLRLSDLLQHCQGLHPMRDVLRQLGQCFDFSEDINKYEAITKARRDEARSKREGVRNKKIEVVRIGKADVLWEQQFCLNTDNIDKDLRKRLLKDYCGIGAHKNFKQKTDDDIDISKPKILDFNNDNIYLASIAMLEQTKKVLSQKSNIERKEFIIDEFGDKIGNANVETLKTIKEIQSSKYWSFVNDYSTLMKNMLSMSQYNRGNTFRIACCANNNLFGILMPSTDIKTRRSTIVYFIVAIHKDKDNLVNPGALSFTYSSKNCYVSVSKAIRLDKERCQRIVTAPGLFLMSTLLMYNNNPTVDLNDVMNFTLYTSLSITKAMLSLTEPSRYMIMNSLAISSDVKGYIADKFSPYTKTLFSVYMTRQIKKACYNANEQKDKIAFRDIYLTDYEITQKGVLDNREIKSIWFPGLVSIKEYINQIYMPFYFNSKGLHEKHHVMIDLVKTVGEIELDQRMNIKEIWSDKPKPQTVNLKVYLHCLAKSLITDTSRHNHLRNKVESRNNFKRSPTTISTFTSSKSCVKIGDFKDFKSKKAMDLKKSIEKQQKKPRLANPEFFKEIDINSEVKHADYEMMRNAIPNYKDYLTTKNFDRLYELYKNGNIQPEETCIQTCLKMMKEHKEHNFAMFNKGQKTAKDREIFEPEWETKAGMYVIERLAKERCKLNLDEMISEPGDGKLKILEQKAEQELRYMVTKQREQKQRFADLDNIKSIKVEINADMTKWSAQDVYYKYFWLIAIDPILYPAEKKRILYFMCNYMVKNLIIPDDVMYTLLDQRINRQNDIFMILTENFTKNYFQVKRNWLQGNFNYTSSYVHSCAMLAYKDIIKETARLLDGESLVNSLVHSDDNHTSIVMVQGIATEDQIIEHVVNTFKTTCLTFGCQANMKKTYFTNFIKEFVSLFNIMGEPFSVYGRFLLTSVGDCAYIGPYEDLSSRISATQSAIKHGCPPSYAWTSIALSHWMTYLTYNMLPGQRNDPLTYFPCESRKELPIELFGCLNSDLSTIAMVGMESQNLDFLVKLLQKFSDILIKKSPIVVQIQQIKKWDLSKLTTIEKIKLKILRYLVLDLEQTGETMGETSDMRSRSILTPRKFTTSGSMNRLVSYHDYQQIIESQELTEQLLDFVIANPELTITKGETMRDFMNMIIFRYNSKRFKESLSIQNPAQLFIEQILFSGKPIIDYERIKEKFVTISDIAGVNDLDTIVGKCTFTEAYINLYRDLTELELTHDDITTIYNYCIVNDPLILTVANSLVLSTVGSPMNRVGTSANTMPEFRSMKLIHHSPALVLRAYAQGRPDVQGANVEEMERDLIHLNNFIEETKILEKLRAKIDSTPFDSEIQRKMFIIRELTRFYQVCYEFIKSAEHKIKVFILPIKTRTTHDFCSVIQGNLIHDQKWFTMHYLKQVVVQGHKSVMSKAPSTDYMEASECFRVLPFFLDSFVSSNFRGLVFLEMLQDYSYKGRKLHDLFDVILRSHNRHEYLPILWHTGQLTQKDLDRYDALKSSERITWNYYQLNREFNTGPIDLTITGYNRELHIVGEDDSLLYAELTLTDPSLENIKYAGRKLLNSRHGLKFEKMKKIDTVPGNYYIVYQRRTHTTYNYQIQTHENIEIRNNENKGKGRFVNNLIPVCPLNIGVQSFRSKLLMRDISALNTETIFISRLNLSSTETTSIKRASLDKMRLFEGPDIDLGALSLNKLMKSQDMMTLDFEKISGLSLTSISNILNCNGKSEEKEDEFDFIAMSDEPMGFQMKQEVDTSPMLNIFVSKLGEKHMSYKNAVKIALKREVERFCLAFDFSAVGFSSSRNLGVLSTITAIVDLLETNEWSTILKNCIHLVLLIDKKDAMFHQFDLPKAFYINPITREVNWVKLKSFLLNLPDVIDPQWAIIYKHFKEKAIALIDLKMQVTLDIEQVLDEISIEGGTGFFEFY
ncbi:RNA-dependent RNA polymerase [Triniti virus]|uniref:RNA-directed RNA polymerase L n=1 Tax=Triniti virus TaxID=2496585 RepID=A0A3S8XFQ5_9VIRU|nr:RNA-dependent RNA polymerase [Triniti virus]AZM68667.1 RNA-dependent RNA polymerase [Triniti virus]